MTQGISSISNACDDDTPPILEMRAITKRFGGVRALEEVSLSIGRAEIVAVIGENGAGKSTLMKVLGGVHAPDGGTILVDGSAATIRSPREATRLGIAFIHQELSVLENLSVGANMFLGREPTGGGPLRFVREAEVRRGATELLRRVGLALSPDEPVANLSLAQRQLVEIARALGQDARLLIMDEPTSSLTPTETDRLLSLAEELKANGVSVIYISHRLREIERIADRVVALRDGKNAGNLSRTEINNDAMVRLMVGRDLQKSAHAANNIAALDALPRLAVRNLQTIRYPNRRVSFDLRAGEVLGFAGLVGAGRTELALALFGIEPPLSGGVTMDGKTVRIRTPDDAIGQGIALVPEDRRRQGLILPLPIRENVTLPRLNRFARSLGWVDAREEKSAATTVLGRLNIKSAALRGAAAAATTTAAAGEAATSNALLESAAQTLSGGNQQKVVLAKWLSLSPKVLIFDEPTRGVDVGAKAEIYELIRNLARSGVSILLISSDLEEVLGISDRIAVLHEGALTGILDKADFSEEAVMRLAVGKIPVAEGERATAAE